MSTVLHRCYWLNHIISLVSPLLRCSTGLCLWCWSQFDIQWWNNFLFWLAGRSGSGGATGSSRAPRSSWPQGATRGHRQGWAPGCARSGGEYSWQNTYLRSVCVTQTCMKNPHWYKIWVNSLSHVRGSQVRGEPNIKTVFLLVQPITVLGLGNGKER